MSESMDFPTVTYEPMPSVSYKPGWVFKVQRPGYSTRLRRMDDSMAEIHVTVSDLQQSEEKNLTLPQLTFRYAVDARCITGDRLAETVRAVVNAIESHETDEWLFVGGIRVTDPHPLGSLTNGESPLVNPLEGVTCV